MSLQVSKESLTNLLKLSQRPQTVSGKAMNQVNAVMLKVNYPKVMACSLVKDGLSSVSLFTIGVIATDSPRDNETVIESSNGLIPITDIDSVLGALQYHSATITLTHKEGNKLVIKSKSKQTTLTSNEDALAFPHSPRTLKDWHQTSLDIAAKIGANGAYHLSNGDIVEPFFTMKEVDVTTLHEALRCVNVNKQKLNEYRFVKTKSQLKVITGSELKGQTEYVLEENHLVMRFPPFDATFGGGLDNITKIINKPKVNLHFIDLTRHGQGLKLIMEFDDDNFLLQSSIGDCEVSV